MYDLAKIVRIVTN